MKRILLSLGITVLALAFLAHAASAAPSKESAGPAVSGEETAIVKSGPYTDLVSVDGAKVSGLSVRLSPGEHTLVMKPNYPTDNSSYTGAYFFYSRVDGPVTFTALSGHTYVAYARWYAAPSGEDQSGADYGSAGNQSDTGFTWVGYVEDKTEHQRVAKTDRLALEAFPRSYGGGAYGGSFMSHH